MKKKWIILISILTILIAVFWYVSLRFPVITGYGAKYMCSCVFIANTSEADATANELDYSFVKYANTEVDYKEKSVTSTIFGMSERTAYYTPTSGCVVADKAPELPVEKVEIKEVNSDFFIDTSFLNKNEKLNQVLSDWIKESNPDEPFNNRSVLVLKGNKLLGEFYTKGFDKDKLQLGWSMAKGVFSALIGKAIKDNIIESTEVNHLFPEWKGKHNDITLNNVLKMNTGIEWEENYGNISEATTMLYLKEDMVKYVKSLGLEADPGTHWEYASGMSNLLGAYLSNQFIDLQGYHNFVYQFFADINATSFFLETDAMGNFVASSYPWATARDWAKFGLLYLNEGSAGTKQIFSPDWIDYTVSPAEDSEGLYGAQFWLHNPEIYKNSPKDLYFSDGFQGQRLFIIPSENLVIVNLALAKFELPDYDTLISEIINAIK